MSNPQGRRNQARQGHQGDYLKHAAIHIEAEARVSKQIDEVDALLEKIVKEDAVVKRLYTTPGVGPVTATTFAATIDDASRFGVAKQVRSYLGLVPREYSSGERQYRGRISKAGAAGRELYWSKRRGHC
jgi:transposase